MWKGTLQSMSLGLLRWGAHTGSCWTGLPSKPSSCHLHEVSCAGLQKVPASLVDFHLSIQLLFPISSMQFCMWPCGLRVWEGGIAYRLGKTVGSGLLLWAYGKPSSTLCEDCLACLLGKITQAPASDPHPCSVVSPMDSSTPHEKLRWT